MRLREMRLHGTRFRGITLTTGLAIVLLGAVACDNAEGGTADSDPTATTPASTEASGSGPQEPTDCGIEEQVHGSGRDLEARRCLADAYAAGSPATFTSTMVTIEGDPIVWTVSTDASGGVEVTLDATEDRFAAPEDRKVQTFHCSGLSLTDADQPATIEITGCDGDTGGSIAI